MFLTKLDSREKNLFLLAIVIHLITAYFSNGFYHWDEHFQILEFAKHKLFTQPIGDLPWEFRERMRPFFLPGVAVIIGKIYYNPFFIAATFRFLAMALSLLAIFIFYSNTKKEFSANHSHAYLILSLFIWFFPYLHVRLSAEVISGAIFLLGYSCSLNTKKNSRFLVAGFLFAISCWIRFQMGFALIGLAIGFLLNQKFSIKSYILMGTGFITAVLMNIGIDSWGYGVWTFTPWQYLYQNIVLGKSSHYGIVPILLFLKWTLYEPGLYLGILFYLAILYNIIRFPKHPLTLAAFVFMIIHYLVPHKELRFLFPIVFLLPWFCMKLLEKTIPEIIQKKYIQTGFLLLNLIPMSRLMVTAAHPAVNFYKTVTNNPTMINTLYIQGHTDPYLLAKLFIKFYHPRIPDRIVLDVTRQQLDPYNANYVFSDLVKYARTNKQLGCELLFTSNYLYTNDFYASHIDIKDTKPLWTLYKCLR